MNEAKKLLEVNQVTKRYPGVVALSNVTLDIKEGEFHSIVGENGAGKSTLMKILSGVITEYEGDIILRGETQSFSGTRDAEHVGIAIIHQELNLVEELSAAANIFLGRELKTNMGLIDDRAMQDQSAKILEQLECPINPAEPVGRLRVGDQQLIEIAKALSINADILIMDEPTSALTEAEVARLDRVIKSLREKGVTILYISHKMDEVFRLSDRISVLRDGQYIDTVLCAETTPKKITHMMVGRELDMTEIRTNHNPGETILEVKNLSLPWPGHAKEWRLKDISFELKRGEIVGFSGLMGAGRTELLECLFGCNPHPIEGEIIVDGKECSFSHPQEAIKSGVALVTEDRKRLGLFADMDVAENITMCSLGETKVKGMLNQKEEHRLAQESVETLSVKTASVESSILSLSGGNQQKCIIGRWLRTNPKVLLLDDPTRGVDVGAKTELYRLIDKLCGQGLGVIVTSSELPELLTMCDRILVLSEGILTGEFSREEATEQKIMEASTLGIESSQEPVAS